MLAEHGEEELAWLGSFETTVSVDVDGLGPTCFCHGSPRSDEECVTERTPVERVREFMADRDEHVVVTAHVHLQYDRVADGIRLLSPGSVGPSVRQRRGGVLGVSSGPTSSCAGRRTTSRTSVARMRATDDPKVEEIAELMLTPPPRDEVIEFAETNVFAG